MRLAASRQTDAFEPVVIYHDETTPAGKLHEVLRVVNSVPNTEAYLALSRYGQLPCEGQKEGR